MNENFIPFGFLITIAVLWGLTAYQSCRLQHKFKVKYPVVAANEIPYSNTNLAHPKKLFFLFTNRAIHLIRNDKELWKEWKRFFCLLVASFFVPFGLGCVLSVFAISCIIYDRLHP